LRRVLKADDIFGILSVPLPTTTVLLHYAQINSFYLYHSRLDCFPIIELASLRSEGGRAAPSSSAEFRL